MTQGIRTLELVTAIDSENPVLGDIRLVNGDFSWLQADDPEATAQGMLRRLRTIMGEVFSDLRRGTPWFAVLGQRGQLARLRSMIRQVINGTPGVQSCLQADYTLDAASRSVSLTWIAIFDDGKRYTAADFDFPFIVELG